MNDLTFGATLLSFFVTLVIAVIVETTGAPTPNRSAAAATAKAYRSAPAAKASGNECATVAFAEAR